MLREIKCCYVPQNRLIRSHIIDKNKLSSYEAEDIANLDNLIKQGTLPRTVTLYRGANAYDFGLPKMGCDEFIEKFYQKGKVFTIPIFPSTSLDKKVALHFTKGRGILFKINAPEGTPALYLENINLPYKNNFGNEEEILLARNLMYKFKNYTKTQNLIIIELDILPKKPLFKKVHKFWKETENKNHFSLFSKIQAFMRKLFDNKN